MARTKFTARTKRPLTPSGRLTVARSELPADFDSRTGNDDPRRSAALWQTFYDADCAASHATAREALIKHYLPLVVALACYYKRTRGHAAPEELDELVSDGSAAVIHVIDNARPTAGRDFKRYVTTAVISSFWQAKKKRTWGGYRKNERASVISNFRKRYTRANSRVPTHTEIEAFLATLITAPSLQIGEGRRMIDNGSISSRRTGRGPIDFAADEFPDAPAQLITRETIRIALKGFKGRDREMFSMLLSGADHRQIAHRFGLTSRKAFNIFNGLLWQARQRADLAKYLDVEPADAAATEPPRNSICRSSAA